MSDVKKHISESGVGFDKNQTDVILQTLSEGVCQISADGKIQYTNRSAGIILQRKETEILDEHYCELFFGKEESSYLQDEPFCPISFVLTSGENAHVNSEVFLQKEGSEVRVEYVCVPLLENGEVTGAVISFEDIAERYEAEKTLERGRDMAIEAAQAKAAFLANMSHEIRTPLNGIVGTTSLLMDSELSEEQRNYARMLKTSTELLRGIVDDILDFSKIESGVFQLEKLDFRIKKVLDETTAFFSPLASEKKLFLDSEIGDDVAAILIGDSGKIRQILNNFVSNAIKFTNNGEVNIKVSLESEDEISQQIRVEVSDTGIGVEDEAQRLLFQPFVQADASTSRLFGGTGLGLAISRQMVEMMDGKVGVSSVFGKGASFWFTVKFEKSLKAVGSVGLGLQEPTDGADRSNISAVFSKDINILIVEDNPINRVVTSKMLEQFGLSPTSVENGIGAIKEVEKTRFDIIFMDCQMPELDGFETTEHIRQLSIDQPKIVALTASTSLVEREKCLKVGMDNFLSKPFTKKDLSDVLRDYFEPESLDLEVNIVQHSLENVIEARRLESFSEIESNGKEHFTEEILNIFVEHSQKLIAEMNECFLKEDFQKLSEIAHNLKGSSGNVGVTKLFNLFEELEEKVKGNNIHSIDNLIKRINSEFELTKQIILSKI